MSKSEPLADLFSFFIFFVILLSISVYLSVALLVNRSFALTLRPDAAILSAGLDCRSAMGSEWLLIINTISYEIYK